MKPLARIAKPLASGIIGIVVVLFGLNYFVRVSDGRSGYGIVEEWLFHRSATSAFSRSLKSNNLKRYEDSSSLSEQIAALLTSKGTRLLTDPSLESERTNAARMARTAHELASAYPVVSATTSGSVGDGAPVISEDSARIPGQVR